MSMTYLVTIRCDGQPLCPRSISGDELRMESLQRAGSDATANADRAGWVRRNDHGRVVDLCQECSKKVKA